MHTRANTHTRARAHTHTHTSAHVLWLLAKEESTKKNDDQMFTKISNTHTQSYVQYVQFFHVWCPKPSGHRPAMGVGGGYFEEESGRGKQMGFQGGFKGGEGGLLAD